MAEILVCPSEVSMMTDLLDRSSRFHRPYLYIYQQSNELEEEGIITLSGVKVEHNPAMELLLGVSLAVLPFLWMLTQCSEATYFHTLYLVQFACFCSTKCQRIGAMDPQTRSNKTPQRCLSIESSIRLNTNLHIPAANTEPVRGHNRFASNWIIPHHLLGLSQSH